jgi:hypothetical protein
MSKRFIPRIASALLSVLAIFASILPVCASESKETSLPILQTKTQAISIFKNGLGFVIRQGEAPLREGWVVSEYAPRPALGSLWIGSWDKDVSIEEVIGLTEEVERETEALSMEGILKANIGKAARIAHGDKIIEGIIKAVPEGRQNPPDERRLDTVSTYMAHPQPKAGEIVIVGTKEGDVILNKAHITRIEFAEPSSTRFLTPERVRKIKVRVSAREDRARLSMSYLQKGISWVPSYLVNIEDTKKARITMKATVINDMEDLTNVDAFFVVGYPNFLYADILSPMALEESIKQFIAALESGGRVPEDRRLANIMRQSVSFERDEEIPGLDYGYSSIQGLPGAHEEDLFLYSKKGLHLKKGERAEYLIFSDEVAYKHIYEWNIPDTLKVDARGYTRSDPEKKEMEQVWHSIKLSNTTAYPWTTAPALTISGSKPLAQDTIDYTPKNSQRNLKLTVATDVSHDRHEFETERQREIRLYNHSYDLVTVKGELYIKNHKSKDIEIEIKKRLTGEVLETSHKGKVEKRAEGLAGVNQNSVISWEIPIRAGAELKVAYRYKVYIAR